MSIQETAPDHRGAGQMVEVAGENLEFRQVVIHDTTPTGAQISRAAGFTPAQQTVVLQFLPDGGLEDIAPSQIVDLSAGNQFIVVETDRLFFLTINGERFEWPSRMISGAVVRKLGKVPPEDELLLTRVDEEPDIMVAFLSEKDLPEPGSIGRLRAFVQDLDAFDLSNIMRDLQGHIVNPERSYDYYRIMEEFARVPRSVWREFKTRLVISLEASKARKPHRAFRFAFPKTDCTFMVASMDPDWPVTGMDGTRMRANAVAMFTEAAKYDLKTRLGVGLLISKDGEYFQLDWCVVDEPWADNPKMEDLLATTSLFGPARERMVDSFLFRDATYGVEV